MSVFLRVRKGERRAPEAVVSLYMVFSRGVRGGKSCLRAVWTKTLAIRVRV